MIERRYHVIPIPIAVGDWATLRTRCPMTEEEWARMVDLLAVMKPALVKSPDELAARDDGLAALAPRRTG